MRLLEFFETRRTVSWAMTLALLPLIAWLDHFTGFEVSFSIFYLFPVSLAAWTAGAGAGLLVSFASAALWGLMDVTSGHIYSSSHIVYWNAAVRLLFFAVTALALARIRAAARREKEQSRQKSEMVSLVSHEVNNALVSISLASTLLQEDEHGDMPENRKKFYSVLDQTHRKLSQTVKVFLAKAKLEAGKFTLEPKRVEFRTLIRESIEALSLLAAEKEVSVWTDFPPDIIPIECDPDAMSLVVSNLLVNAIKYTPAGGKVTVRISCDDPACGKAEISVADTGIGIAATDLKAIFSGFYRAEDGQRKAKGFGIGLKASREMIEAHGSELKVASEPGHGSRFYFMLPVWKEPA